MESRLFDVNRGVTRAMRGKEEAHDYRYFPEPDLVPLIPDRQWVNSLLESLPELPYERRRRFIESYGLPEHDALLLTNDKKLADIFWRTASKLIMNLKLQATGY